MSFAPLRCFLLLAVITISFSGTCLSALANTQQIKPTSIAKKLAERQIYLGCLEWYTKVPNSSS